jgi:4-amino-4-deoxy-L-arabinose transferase-like glycosyltransferase
MATALPISSPLHKPHTASAFSLFSPPLLLAAWCAALFFYGLSAGELRQNEGLRALLGAEMLRRGDWIVPWLYDEPLLTKPPGMYAAVAVASWPFGSVTPWSARLPSALAATAAVWIFYCLFARRLGRAAGFAAAVILPASFMWVERVPSAEIDMLQLAWTVGALGCFLRALEEAEGEQRFLHEWLWMQAALMCTAGGVLTKWTTPAFFYLTVLPLLLWRGRLRLLLRPAHLLSVAVAAGVCVAWATAAVAEVGWTLFSDTISREMLLRLSPLHHPRPYPWGELIELPLLVLGPNLPWSALALVALHPAFSRRWDDRSRRFLQLLQCWTWANLLFWTIVPGHRPRHCLPLQPGLAGLATFVWAALASGRLRWPWRLHPAAALAGVALLWLTVKIAYVHVIVPERNRHYAARAAGEQLDAWTPRGEGLWLCQLKDETMLFYSGRRGRRAIDLATLAAQPGPLYVALTEREWRRWPADRTAHVLGRTRDGQREAIVLIEAP